MTTSAARSVNLAERQVSVTAPNTEASPRYFFYWDLNRSCCMQQEQGCALTDDDIRCTLGKPR